jgi:hypothetical protein
MRFLLILLAASACISDVPQVNRIVIAKKQLPKFCLRGTAFYNGRTEPLQLCTETRPACEKAMYLAKTYGTFANLRQIDKCEEEL